MLFNTPEFIFVFLPAAVLLHFLLARRSVFAACVTTTVTSLIFSKCGVCQERSVL